MRLLIFTDVNGPVTAGLIEATMRLSRERDDIEVVGIVTSRPREFSAPRRRHRSPRRIDVVQLRREHGTPLLETPNGDPNDPAFLETLRNQVGADVAVSYYCLRRLKRPLLDLFEQTVNFHNSLLPMYRGVRATSFAMYNGETEAGFTFHRMVEEIDAGPILLQEGVPIHEDDTLSDVSMRMVAQAVVALPRAFDLLATGDPGRSQTGPASHVTRQDVRAMVKIEHPEQLTANELQRRLRAFGGVSMTIDNSPRRVTRLGPASPRQALAFRTADGALVAPVVRRRSLLSEAVRARRSRRAPRR